MELVDALGLCEHCNALVSVTQYAGDDAADAKWGCGSCKKDLSHKSFGYDKGTKGAEKVRWVGPDGKWMNQKPKNDFELGSILVVTRMPKFHSLL